MWVRSLFGKRLSIPLLVVSHFWTVKGDPGPKGLFLVSSTNWYFMGDGILGVWVLCHQEESVDSSKEVFDWNWTSPWQMVPNGSFLSERPILLSKSMVRYHTSLKSVMSLISPEFKNSSLVS